MVKSAHRPIWGKGRGVESGMILAPPLPSHLDRKGNMTISIDTILRDIRQQPVRQDSLTSQLDDLHNIAIRFGLYDAADFLDKLYRREFG